MPSRLHQYPGLVGSVNFQIKLYAVGGRKISRAFFRALITKPLAHVNSTYGTLNGAGTCSQSGRDNARPS
jgi:hypothetical protein